MAAEGTIGRLANKNACSICLEPFSGRFPKILPCFHTFCLHCLTTIVERSAQQAAKGGITGEKVKDVIITCPTCRRDCIVPPGGAGEFQKNFYLEQEESGPVHLQPLICDLCDQGQVASHMCTHCQLKLCFHCHRSHSDCQLSRQPSQDTVPAIPQPESCVQQLVEKGRGQMKVMERKLAILDAEEADLVRQRKKYEDALNQRYTTVTGMIMDSLTAAHDQMMRDVKAKSDKEEERMKKDKIQLQNKLDALTKLLVYSDPADASVSNIKSALLPEAEFSQLEKRNTQHGLSDSFAHKIPQENIGGLLKKIKEAVFGAADTGAEAGDIDPNLLFGDGDLSTKSSEVSQYSATISELERKVELLMQDNHERKRVGAKRDLVDEMRAIYDKNTLLLQEVAVLQAENGALRQDVNKMQAESGALRQDVNKIQAENGALRQDVNKIQGENGAQRQDMNKIQGENGALRQDMNKINGENGALRQDVSKMQCENGALRQDVSKMQGENVALRQDVNKMQGENGTLRQDVNKMQGENGALRQDVNKMQGENGTLRQDVNKMLGEIGTLRQDVNKMQGENGALLQDMNKMQAGLHKLQTDVNSISGQLQTSVGQYVNKNRPSATGTTAADAHELATVKAEVKTLQMESKEFKADLKAVQMESQLVKTDLKTSQVQVDSILSQVTSLQVSQKRSDAEYKRKVSHLMTRIDQLKTPVYFRATLDQDVVTDRQRKLILTNVFANEGGGYNCDSGMFVTPVSGTYLFIVSVEPKAAGAGAAEVEIITEGGIVIAYALSDVIDVTSTGVGVAVLTPGQRVWLRTFQDKTSFHGTDTTCFIGVLLMPQV